MTNFIAHRGYSIYEKENTIPAFLKAAKCDYFYGIETDVHITKDHKYVLMHDNNTLRVTDNRVDFDIEKNLYSEAKEIVLSDINGNPRDDLRIPFASDYFKICKEYNKVAVFELKQLFKIKELKEIIQMIKDEGMYENTIIISFISENFLRIRSFDKNIKMQLLFGKLEDWHYDFLIKYNLGIDAWHEVIDENLIKFCKDNNLSTNAWTVDNKKDAKRLMDLGIDFITSNALNINDMREE